MAILLPKEALVDLAGLPPGRSLVLVASMWSFELMEYITKAKAAFRVYGMMMFIVSWMIVL